MPKKNLPEIERVLIRPSQSNLEVTTALTGIVPDPEMCNICTGTVRGIGDHHITFRGRGGKAGPVLPLCTNCHIQIHEGHWMLYASERGLELEDEETGEIIWRLLRYPFDGQPGDVVQALDSVTELQKHMTDIAPSLMTWQALEVYRALKEVGSQGWRATARLITEMYRYRTPGLAAGDKIEAIMRFFDLRKASVYNYLNVIEALGETPAFEESPLSMEMMVEASRTDDPEAWVKVFEERKVQHPQFNRGDAREEVNKAGASKAKPKEDDGGEPDKKMVYAVCGHCGVADWMESMPVGSDGKPVEIKDYQS